MSELSAAIRARIARRWPTAAAFYAERDDRTVRVIGHLATYAERPVEIHVDPATAEDVTVQRIALVAANLTMRWARRVRVVMPSDARLDGVLRRDGATTLSERITRERAMSDPFGDSSVGERPLRLFVGPWRENEHALGSDDFQVHAVHWTALGRRGSDMLHGMCDTRAPATSAAAGLAASLGAADLFKRAIGHARVQWLGTFAWNTWSSRLSLGSGSWSTIVEREVPAVFDFGRTLLAGVGAIGSAFVYLVDMMPLSGRLVLLDRDAVDVTNLNRSPLFTVLDAFDGIPKTTAGAKFLAGRGVDLAQKDGLWREHVSVLAAEPFDIWISLTNEDGAWAELPFQLPPVVVHGTTTSGWGFGAGRHIPRLEDCTLCRMPRPAAEFRGPCAEGEIAPVIEGNPIRASLPFLSTASASLVLAICMQLECGAKAVNLANAISVDLGAGLPAVIALNRGPTPGCRGCRAVESRAWAERGGRGRFAELSHPFIR